MLTRRRFVVTCINFAVATMFMRPQTSLGQFPQNVAEVLAGRRKVANAAWWGYNTISGTEALQGAILSGAERVFVPNMGTPWIIEPIWLESNQVIEFEDGVVLLARKGAFRGKNDCLMKAINKENITLIGSQTVLKMRRRDYAKRYYEKSEWRHCLSFCGCRNINITGLHLVHSGGDGLYVGRGIGGNSRRYCENIIVNNVICDRNYRQGISVISARNLLIEKCVLSNTEGTSPQAGIDYEPNRADELLQNCALRDTIIYGNRSSGLVLALIKLNKNSIPISLTVERCSIRQNGGNALRIICPDSENSPAGRITFRGNQIEGSCVIDQISNVELLL